jgi:hypothetical protein
MEHSNSRPAVNLRYLTLSTFLLCAPGLSLAAQDVPPARAVEPVAPVQEVAKNDVLGAMAWVPKGASTVILVNHPSRTLEAMDRLANRMKLKGAALMRQALVDDFGGEPLMDLDTSLVEFSYPLQGDKSETASKTVQLRIMRVPSMKEFQTRFKAKVAKGAKAPSDGFFEGQVKGKSMLAAFRGGYAILAPKANPAVLKAALAEREVFPLPPQSQRGWLLEQDVAMLFPLAVLAENATKKDDKKDNFLAPVDALMEMVRKNPEREVSHIAIGAKTEEGGGISFEARLGFTEAGQAAQVVAGLQGSLADVVGAATKGLPASAYVIAMTAAMPAGYVSWLNATLESQGAAVSAERKERMSQILHGLKSFGLVWGLDPQSVKPIQGAVLSMQVEDAETSLRALEAYAKLKPESGEAMTTERSDHMGRTLLKFVVPSAKPKTPQEGEEPKNPMLDPLAIFGKEPVATLLWAYDPHTLLVGFGDAGTAFTSSLEALEHPEKSLGQLPAFALTQDMLGSEQQMQLFLSLQDIVGALGRMLPIPIELSASAKTAPPLGLGFGIASSGLTLRAVAPGETVELVGTILESAMKMSRNPKPEVTAEPKAEETTGEEKAEQPAPKKAPGKNKKAVKKTNS